MFKWAFWGVAGCAFLSCGSGFAAQEVRPLAVIWPKPARTFAGSPWQHESPPARVIGMEQSAPLEILRAAIDLESNQRGFFLSVPEYRVRFAYETIREAFSSAGVTPADYKQLYEAILKRNQKPELVFELDWRVSPRGEIGQGAHRLVSASGSHWDPSILQWIPVPENQEQFMSALRDQLNALYRSNTRRRTLEEVLSQQLPFCLQGAMLTSPAEIRLEYQKARDSFRTQQTLIRFEIIRGSEGRMRSLIQEMDRLQKMPWERFVARNPKPTRAQISRMRRELIATIQKSFSEEQWESRHLHWPIRDQTRERDLGGLSSEQQAFALRAPLGQVLLPNTLELLSGGKAEVWIVSDEVRGETFQHPVTDPEVVAILKNRLQTRDYISCAKRWFSRFRRERIALEQGVQVSDSHWDLAVATFMGAR
jgi:hypothetical protein